MADKLLASHLLAKVTPPALLLYLIVGSSAAYEYRVSNGVVEECSRSVDFIAFILAGVGLLVSLFLLRIAMSPRNSSEEEGVFGNRVGAVVVAILVALLVLKGFSAAEDMAELAKCNREGDV